MSRSRGRGRRILRAACIALALGAAALGWWLRPYPPGPTRPIVVSTLPGPRPAKAIVVYASDFDAPVIRDAEARHAPLTVDTQPLPARAVTEVTVYTADHAGLFSRIAGALAVAGASIVDARIHTLTNGSALDTFWIQDAAGGAFDAPHRLARLHVLIDQALSGRLGLANEISRASRNLLGRRMRAIHVPSRVVVDNRASNTHTVLEVNGRDRPGLLHDVTAAISEQGLQIASAHVTTYGVRAVGVFYVKDVFGLKVENERKLAALRLALLAALQLPDEDTPEPAPPARRRREAAA